MLIARKLLRQGFLSATIRRLSLTPPYRHASSDCSRNETVSIAELPWSCPGCGAYSRLTGEGGPGYYSSSRKSVMLYTLGHRSRLENIKNKEDDIINRTLRQTTSKTPFHVGFDLSKDSPGEPSKCLNISR